jgi:hypothetical protein
MRSCSANPLQGGRPSNTPKTEGPFGMGRKVIVFDSLLSAAAVWAFKKPIGKEQKAVISAIK